MLEPYIGAKMILEFRTKDGEIAGGEYLVDHLIMRDIDRDEAAQIVKKFQGIIEDHFREQSFRRAIPE